VRRGAAALAFLTRVPIDGLVPLDSRDVARGTVFFPLIGAGVGAATGLVAVGCAEALPVLLAAGLALAFEAALTGAIHLDALADLADSLGARSRERALEIMREPTIGAFGAAALVFELLLKAGALAALLSEDDLVAVVAVAFAAGRAAPLVIGWALPYARTGEGSGRALTDEPRAWERVAGLAVAAAFVFGLTGLRGFALAGGAVAAMALVAFVGWRRVGGATGDVLGAGIELATLGALLAAVATT
jgi:adenosylcobinamide-GDP ribazoletransferase